jgi:hypothetical protein
MNCPVCNVAEISQDDDRCPSCESDLTSYRYIHKVEQHRNTLRTMSIVFGVLLLAMASTLLFMPSSAEQPAGEVASRASSENSPGLDEMKATLHEKDSEIASLKDDLESAIKGSVATAAIQTSALEENASEEVHIVKSGESVWDIAKTYFGDNRYFGKIAWDNNLANMSQISVGDTLIIKH